MRKIAICTLSMLLMASATFATSKTSAQRRSRRARVPVLRLGPSTASLDGRPVSIPGDPGFLGRAASQAASGGEPLATALGSATAIKIVLRRDTDLLRITEALSAAQSASVVRYHLEFAGRRVGPFTILGTEEADLVVDDLYFGDTTPQQQSTRQFRRRRGRVRAELRIVFVLDLGTTPQQLLRILAPARGAKIGVGFHLGPY